MLNTKVYVVFCSYYESSIIIRGANNEEQAKDIALKKLRYIHGDTLRATQLSPGQIHQLNISLDAPPLDKKQSANSNNWLGHMPYIPFKMLIKGIPMIHKMGGLERTTIRYDSVLDNWRCSYDDPTLPVYQGYTEGGVTKNYRINLDKKVGFEYAQRLCFLHGALGNDVTSKMEVAKFLKRHSDDFINVNNWKGK